MTSVLRVFAGKKLADTVNLPGAPLVIGRSNKAGLCLKDNNISREHCIIRKIGEHFILTDLNSSNGTLYRGRRLIQMTLADGDVVTIGPFSLKYEDGSGNNPRDDEEHDRAVFAYSDDRTETVARQWKIRVMSEEMDKTVPLLKDEYMVGSGMNADILIDGKGVEHSHLFIIKSADSLVVLNCAKKAPTTINNNDISSEVILKEPSLIKIGDYTLAVEAED